MIAPNVCNIGSTFFALRPLRLISVKDPIPKSRLEIPDTMPIKHMGSQT